MAASSYTTRTLGLADIDTETENAIEHLALGIPRAGVWQTVAWARMLAAGWQVHHAMWVGSYTKGSELVASGIIEFRQIALRKIGAFIVGGPVYTQEHVWCVPELLQKATQVAKQAGAVFLQMEPLQEGIDFLYPSLNLWTQNAYKEFIVKHTATINLTQDTDIILANFKQKGRYNIRVAEKADITCTITPTPADEDMVRYHALASATAARQGFSINSKKFFLELGKYLSGKTGRGCLIQAWHRGNLAAAAICTRSGDTFTYYYGASSDRTELRQLMAPYILQWKAIQYAKEVGATYYDFLGIAPPNTPNHHLSGVTDFKMRFGPECITLPEAHLLVLRPFWWKLIGVLRALRRFCSGKYSA